MRPTQNAVRIGPDPVQDVADVNRFAVYVRIEDNAGHGEEGAQDNVTYIGHGPLCDIDKTAPVVEGIVDGGALHRRCHLHCERQRRKSDQRHP